MFFEVYCKKNFTKNIGEETEKSIRIGCKIRFFLYT